MHARNGGGMKYLPAVICAAEGPAPDVRRRGIAQWKTVWLNAGFAVVTLRQTPVAV